MKLWTLLGGLVVVALTSTFALAQEDDLMDGEDDVIGGGEDMVGEDDINFDDGGVEDVEDEEDVPPPPPKEKPVYKKPDIKGNPHFVATFEDEADFAKTWVLSKARKEDTEEDLAKYDGRWAVEELANSPLVGDMGLVLKSKAKHHAVSSKLKKPYYFSGKPFIVQYEVNFQNGQECGGAYVKLLTDKNLNLENFMDKTPYTIMFGPDKCGSDSKLHFIFRHKHPITGEFEEKHAKKPKEKIDKLFSDKKTHVFQLIIMPDSTFEIYVDRNLVNSGSLLEDMEPPINPPKEIVDPNDKKPEDWDEREKIPDPDAEKPDDWDENEPEMIPDETATMPSGWLEDEPELIPDPDAEKPSDWDEDMDGEWEAPQISNPACESAPGCGKWEPPQVKNPKYKGKWKAPMIDNPDFQGKWKPRMIRNPNYFHDSDPYKMTAIGAVGLELWSMSDQIYFDNFVLTDDRAFADQFIGETWDKKHEVEQAGSSGSGEGIISSLWAAAEERKWLYAVYLVVLLLPITLLSIYLCPRSGPGVDREELAARRKKTDEPTEDQDEEDDTEVTEDGGGDAPAAKAKKQKSKKADLEAEPEQEDGEADAEEDEEEEEEAQTSQRRSSPRKRKQKPQKE